MAAYKGNIGAVEMIQFYQIASDSEISLMERIAANENWVEFKKLIKKVVGINLK